MQYSMPGFCAKQHCNASQHAIAIYHLKPSKLAEALYLHHVLWRFLWDAV